MSYLNFIHPLGPFILGRMRPIEGEGIVDIPATVSNDWTTVAKLTFPEADRGFVMGYGYDVNDPSYDFTVGTLLFRIVNNDQPVQDLSSMVLQHGTPIAQRDTMIYAMPMSVIALQVRRAIASTLAHTVSALLSGVAWPQKYCLPFDDSIADPAVLQRHFRAKIQAL